MEDGREGILPEELINRGFNARVLLDCTSHQDSVRFVNLFLQSPDGHSCGSVRLESDWSMKMLLHLLISKFEINKSSQPLNSPSISRF